MYHSKSGPLPNIQYDVMDASGHLGIPTTDGGICNGFATMAIFANLDDSLDVFAEQIWLIHDVESDPGTTRRSAPAKLESVDSFLWDLNVAQDPGYYGVYQIHFHKEDQKDGLNAADWEHQDFMMAYTHLLPERASAVSLYDAHATYSFTQDNMLDWSNALYATSASHTDEHMQCLLVSSSHAIALIYDADTNTWKMLDANGSVDLYTPYDMSGAIMTHTWQDGEATFACQWIADEEACWYQTMLEQPRFLENSLAHPDITDASGESGLWLAAYTGDTDFVEAYVAHMHNNQTFYLNQTCFDGWTPLCASMMNDSDAFHILLDAGANTELATSGGYTPLTLAAYWQQHDNLNDLLEHGADVKHASEDGWTALHIACVQGDMFSAQMLLEYGADINAISRDNETPMSLAQDYGHDELVAFLSTGYDVHHYDDFSFALAA